MIFNVEVKNRIITLNSVIEEENGISAQGVGGNKGDKVYFTLDSEWFELFNTTELKATFIWKGKYYMSLLKADEEGQIYCDAPIIYNSNNFYLGIYAGEDADESTYKSTTRVEIPCKLSIRDYTNSPHDDYGGNYTDLANEAADRAEEAATRAEEAADRAESIGGGSVELDTTLTIEGKAADAKAVGDRFGEYVDDVDALIGGEGTEGGGSSSGGGTSCGGGIIDVTELPTEGIDEQSIYRVENATAEWWLYESGYKGNFGELIAQEKGGTLTMLVCDELPQTFVVSTQTAFTVYVMRNNGEMYVSLDGTTATLFLDLLASMGMAQEPFHGAVGSQDEMTEEGYYTLITATQTYHACKGGNWFEFADQKGVAMKSVECANFDEVYTAISSILSSNPFISIVQVCCDGYVSAVINSATTYFYPCSFGVNIVSANGFGVMLDALCYALKPTILQVAMQGGSSGISSTTVQYYTMGGTDGTIDDADFSGLKNIRILYF